MILRLSAIAFAALAANATAARADAWTFNQGTDVNGTSYAYAELEGDVTFSLSCQKDQPGLMRFLMTVGDLPGLPALDDQSAALTLSVTSSGTTHNLSFSPWYYGAESTWTGPLEMTTDDVQALFNAEHVSLANAHQEAVLTYSPAPSGTAAQAVLASCTFSPPD